MNEEYREYQVVRHIERSPTTATLWIVPAVGDRPDFIPGQFVNILLPGHGSDAKSYSISSVPSDPGFALTVRAAGPFSRTLAARREFETLLVSSPYGYFYPVDTKTPRLCLAGGIGICPLISFICASVEENACPKTALLYSNRNAKEMVFYDLCCRLSRGGLLSVRYFLTREQGTLPGAVHGRIGAEHLREVWQQDPEGPWFLCGSIAFVRDMRLMLKSLRVPEEVIFTEAFF